MSKFVTIKEAINEALEYIEGRMKGEITSLKTGYPKLDKCMIDGIEWNSILTIGGRPGVGKSTIADCIIDGIFHNNKNTNNGVDFELLDFNWELSSRVILLRRLCSKIKKSYKYLLSADNNTISFEEFKKMETILNNAYGTLPITYVEEPLSVKEFGETVTKFVSEKGKPTIVRVDHTLLTKMTSSDMSQSQMLLNLLGEANRIKKQLPVTFILLTQLNREFEDRQEDGSDKAYPRQGDVYGGKLNKNSHNYLCS